MVIFVLNVSCHKKFHNAVIVSCLCFQDVSHNMLVSLPKTIGYLSKLVRFNVASNRISELPREIGGMNRKCLIHFIYFVQITQESKPGNFNLSQFLKRI